MLGRTVVCLGRSPPPALAGTPPRCICIPPGVLDAGSSPAALREPAAVVLVDGAWAMNAVPALLRTLHGAQPDALWLLHWQRHGLPPPALLYAGRFEGVVGAGDDWAAVRRRFDQGRAGEASLPRGFLSYLLDFVELGEGPETAPPLTGREGQVLALLREGLTNRQIAERLDISINTVKKHVGAAYAKRGLRHRRQLLKAKSPPGRAL
jgi:DNA-binding CsgD family transcriptional regulator